MLNKILGLFAFLSGLSYLFFKMGSKNEKNKLNEAIIEGVNETKDIKEDISKLSRNDKLDML